MRRLLRRSTLALVMVVVGLGAVASAGASALASGTITIAGKGTASIPGYSGDGGPAISERLYQPHGVGVDGQGTPKVPTAKLYDVRITSNLKTTWIDHGCGGSCEDGYSGTQLRTLTVKGLRVTFRDLGFTLAGSIEVKGTKTGVQTTAWDHQTRFCEPEEPVVKTVTAVAVLGGYDLKRKSAATTLRINSGPAGPPKGDPITCSSNVQIVPVAARISGSLVGGQLTDSYVSLAIKVAKAANGKLGFPLNRITSGQGFTLTLSGKSVSNQEDVKLKKQETVTTGSVRIVFTPRARA